MKAIATGTGWNRWRLIADPNARPSTAAGRNAIARFRTKRRESPELPSVTATFASRARYSQHTARIAPQLDHDLEQLALLVVEIEQRAHDDQVAGAGDGQELGEAFDHAEDEGLEEEDRIHEGGGL